jgi:hypothetical protein
MGAQEDEMSRIALPFHVEDIAGQVAEIPENPRHLSLMKMPARGAGFTNFQAFRASAVAGVQLSAPAPMADMTKVTQALCYFDDQARMIRWASKTNLQQLCLWVIWAGLPKGEVMTERAALDRINALHLFGDAAIIRRTT